MKRNVFILLAFVTVWVTGCNRNTTKTDIVSVDPLPSWNETSPRHAIITFVDKAVTKDSPGFIPVADRIAVFDNDGTLWCEQPLYFEMTYGIAATRQIASENPELQKKPEINALVKGDMTTFFKSGEKGILETFVLSHTAVSPSQFDNMAAAWLDTAKHARFNQSYSKLTYQPMVELLEYLRANDFKTYIVSGGSNQFIRLFSDDAYGIPAEQVVGTMLKATYTEKDYSVSIKPELWHMNDGAGKPEAIFQVIGKRPVLAFGNSDGDLQMLQYTSANTLPSLCLYLHHTDSIREYAYDRTSDIGRLDKGLDEAVQKKWVVVDMKNDFKKIFAFE